MKNANELTTEHLQDLHDRLVQYETPRTFFLTLFEYLEEYENNPILTPIWKSIVKLGNEEVEPMKKLETKNLADIDLAYQEVKKYVEKNAVTNPLVLDAIRRYDSYKKGELTTSQSPVKAAGGFVTYALLGLLEDKNHDHFPFVQKFGTFTDDKRVKEWTLSPSYYEWEEQENYIERIKLTKVWHSWDKLGFFYNLYKNYETMRKDLYDKKEFMSLLGLNDIFRDLNATISYKEDPKRYLKQFDVVEYKIHLQRVHSFVKRALLTSSEKKLDSKRIPFSFIENSLNINGKEVKFKKDTRKFRFVELLLANPKGFYFSEMTEEIEGSSFDGTKDIKNICYEICRGIQNSLAKIGVTDFIEYDFNHAKINKTYKKTSN